MLVALMKRPAAEDCGGRGAGIFDNCRPILAENLYGDNWVLLIKWSSNQRITSACQFQNSISLKRAWWMMHKWLQDFAYRIEIGWWIFLAAGIATFIIALATVSLQSIKAATADPAECLRAE